MYAPPPPTNARRNGLAAGGPLLAICCLLCILFIIAATIVLALIPVYVQKDITASKYSKSSTFVMSRTGIGKRQAPSTLCEGDLIAPTMANLEDAINKALGFPPGTTIIEFARNTGQIPTRRRRGFGSLYRRDVGPIITYAPSTFNKTGCGRCGSTSFLEGIKPFSITVTIYYAGNICSPEPVTYTVTIRPGQFVFPPLSPTTTNTTVAPTTIING